MRNRWWQQQQKKQAQQQRQKQGYYWQQKQAQQQRQKQGYYWQQKQAQQQKSQSRWQPQHPPVAENPDWNYNEAWEDDGGVLGFIKAVLKFVVVGAILFLVLQAIF